jgi:hypothetical protein
MNDVKNDSPGTTSLVQGIVGDIGEMIKHELRYARAEFLSDMAKMKTAAAFLLAGGAALAVGLVLLSLMAAHGLHYASLPAEATQADRSLPLWGAYGIVGGVLAVIGLALGWLGSDRMSRVNPLPDQTLENVQKDVSWIAKQTANSK